MQEDTHTGMIGTKQGFYESMNESTHYDWYNQIMFKSKASLSSQTLSHPHFSRG